MELNHRFSVPVGVEETWAHFNDIASLAQCFPGAQVTEADAESFSGSVKVKLGPIALQYLGTGSFVEKDEAAKRFVVDAKGKDKRGNGTAGAKVTVSMAESAGDAGATEVSVATDLAITGKPAQFGRGVMQDVSDKLLGQFVSCLEQRLGAPEEPAPAEAPAATEPEAPVATGDSPVSPVAPVPPVAPATPSVFSAPPSEPEALDLGAAVLPVLAKSYWKQAVGGLAVVAVLFKLLRRRRR